MANLDNESFQQLIQQIKTMNKNLESSTSASNNLTIQLINMLEAVNFILPRIANIALSDQPPTYANGFDNGTGEIADAGQAPTNGNASDKNKINSDDSGDQAPRVLGYVNWDSSHDTLKSQKLVEITSIRTCLDNMKASLARITTAKSSEKVSTSSTRKAIAHTDEPSTPTGIFDSLYQNYHTISNEKRFPEGAIYVDINSPEIEVEIDFMNKLNTPPTAGVIKRFMTIVKNAMHTRGSFEKQQGLKWV